MHPEDVDDHRGWIHAACREFGLSIAELARMAGLAPSTLTRFLKDQPSGGMLSGRTLHKLRNAELRLRRSDPDPSPAGAVAEAVRDDRRPFDSPAPTGLRLFALDLAPADAIGPPGSGELELVRRAAHTENGQMWPALDDSVRLFAVYMPGEFMRPRFRAGECLLIDRTRPASINNEVLVEFAGGPSQAALGTIAELVDRDRSQVKLRQFQYGATATIHRSEIRLILPVVGAFQSGVVETSLRMNLEMAR